MGGKRHKEARRLERRLADLGRIDYDQLDRAEDAHRWVDEFLALEARGWKGRGHTALACQRQHRDFFRAVVEAAFASHGLTGLALRLNGRPIAMKCNFTSGDAGFAFKIAYDEELARYSPGVLLELENIRRFDRREDLRWMDSCADPRHPMIDRLWRQRRTIQTTVAGVSRAGTAVVACLPLLRRLTAPARRWLAEESPEGARSLIDTTLPTPATAPLDPIDASLFREAFNHRPFIITHRLAAHPLFAVPRLLELAKALPVELVEYNSGELPVSVDRGETPRNGLSAEETIRRIEHCKSWLVLKNVERDAEYGRLLRQCLAQVAEHSESIVPGMCRAEGFIFLSSPGSVTPYHIDPEYNFLLQIRGRKSVHMFDGACKVVLPEESLESFYVAGATRNLAFQDEFRQYEWVNELGPGQGLHFPLTFPHWVQNGPEVSISFSITFRAEASNRREVLCRINHRLRGLGLRPAPVGAAPWRDEAKYAAFRVMRGLKRFASRGRAGQESSRELATTSRTP